MNLLIIYKEKRAKKRDRKKGANKKERKKKECKKERINRTPFFCFSPQGATRPGFYSMNFSLCMAVMEG